jgi:hypothetical protein
METLHKTKNRGSTSFLTSFYPDGSFIPNFGFTFLHLARIKYCKPFGLIPNFVKLIVLIFFHFLDSSNWGWNRNYGVKLGPKDRLNIWITLLMGHRTRRHLVLTTKKQYAKHILHTSIQHATHYPRLVYLVLYSQLHSPIKFYIVLQH